MKTGRKTRGFLTWLGMAFGLLLGPYGPVTLVSSMAAEDTAIRGVVVGEDGGPISGATVRVKATDRQTTSDSEGRFTLSSQAPGQAVFVTAWKSGYYINGVKAVLPGTADVKIILHAHTDTDNPDYVWLPSTYHQGQGENQGCAECHSNAGTGLAFTLPVDEWREDAHSRSATNPRFLTMYAGTNVSGNRSPPTRYGFNRDYGRFPLRPDLTQPYYGPGYKLDFPHTAGNCAACHTPAGSINAPYGTDPTTASGVASEGIPCDFCHKVWDVRLDSASGRPCLNMPGVLSFEFRRPPEGHQFFAGPFDDVAPGEDTYSPIQQRSQYCAPCHFGVFWDTVVYNSFGEWRDSPYSDPQRGRTCQDCHMPRLGATHFALPDKGAAQRDPQTIFSHLMPGASSTDLLRDAVTMSVSARRAAERIVVDVTVVNDKTGHHVPTDSPLRHMILLVRATDAEGHALPLEDGPTVPTWGGVGDPAEGYYAGQPGKAFAKVLRELWTEITPTGAYWNPTRIVSDNRLAAFATDTSTYTFAAPSDGKATIETRLIFRRAFKTLMDQKGWETPDIIMEQTVVSTP